MHLSVYSNHSLFLIRAGLFFQVKIWTHEEGCCAVLQSGDAGEGPVPRRLLPLVRLQAPPALGQTLPVRTRLSLGL